MLDMEKWRVAKYVVQVSVEAATARPWQLQAPAPVPPTTKVFGVWGVWPPQWDVEKPPLLQFPPTLAGWHQAFNAAFDRAQFAAVPPIKQLTEFPVLPTELEYPHNGTP